ncbi:hypothetical protein [Undibacterium sp.]|jgi:hypothetical protein|uniref:hypothetical protein n=1 Tax=Undibacterium sp. TaxID=1914977 RepID=UPI0025DE00D2|nr:hypothetical protein [Undibacterium sp.]
MAGSLIIRLIIDVLILFALFGIIFTSITETFQIFLQQICAEFLQQHLQKLFSPQPVLNQAIQNFGGNNNNFYEAVLSHFLNQPLPLEKCLVIPCASDRGTICLTRQ